jgi:hypothetical protein
MCYVSAINTSYTITLGSTMIIRILVVDPHPRDPRDDIVVYQVPEKSRAHELLLELLEDANLEYAQIDFVRKNATKITSD